MKILSCRWHVHWNTKHKTSTINIYNNATLAVCRNYEDNTEIYQMQIIKRCKTTNANELNLVCCTLRKSGFVELPKMEGITILPFSDI